MARTTDPDAACLSATANHITDPVDLMGLAGSDGLLVGGRAMTIAGHGVAAVLELPKGLEDSAALRSVVERLDSIDLAVAPDGGASENGPGSTPIRVVALGAFPFDRKAPAFLVVPSVAWCRRADGATWRVNVSAPPTPPLEATPRAPVPRPRLTPIQPSTTLKPALVTRPSKADYAAAVTAALEEIRAGRLSKVVLSRMVEVTLTTAADPASVLQALWGGDPVFSPFSVPIDKGRLVGASPELIVSRIGTSVTSHPFAGTIPLGPIGREDPAKRLFASPKDRNEHRLVVEAISAALRHLCTELDVPQVPSVVALRSDARLGSIIRGKLRQSPTEGNTALDILALLHPTPAVGGVPREAALKTIASLEPDPRGYWAGVTGWVDSSGDGEWVLAIRSVILEGRRAWVRAGAGIVEDSEPAAELDETTVKLSPVLDALRLGTESAT